MSYKIKEYTLYTVNNDTLYICSTNKLLKSGVLNNEKDEYEIIKYYADRNFAFWGSDYSSDWDLGGIYFYSESCSGVLKNKSIKRDTIMYTLFPASFEGIELIAFSIWQNKLDVGGFSVGDSSVNIIKKLHINIALDSINVITFLNPNYPTTLNNPQLALWYEVPESISFILRADTIYNIKNTNFIDGICYGCR